MNWTFHLHFWIVLTSPTAKFHLKAPGWKNNDIVVRMFTRNDCLCYKFAPYKPFPAQLLSICSILFRERNESFGWVLNAKGCNSTWLGRNGLSEFLTANHHQRSAKHSDFRSSTLSCSDLGSLGSKATTRLRIGSNHKAGETSFVVWLLTGSASRSAI